MLNSLSYLFLCLYFVWHAEISLCILYGLLNSVSLCVSLSVFCIKCRFLSLAISFVFIELSLQMMLFGACDKQAVQSFCLNDVSSIGSNFGSLGE